MDSGLAPEPVIAPPCGKLADEITFMMRLGEPIVGAEIERIYTTDKRIIASR